MIGRIWGLTNRPGGYRLRLSIHPKKGRQMEPTVGLGGQVGLERPDFQWLVQSLLEELAAAERTLLEVIRERHPDGQG